MPKAGKGKAQALEILHQTIEGGTQDQSQSAGVILNEAAAPASEGKTEAAIEVLHETIEGGSKAPEAALNVLHETVEGYRQESGNGKAARPHAERTGVAANAAEQPVRQASRLFVVAGGAGREAARQASRNVQGLTQTGSVLARGFQDLSREWINFAQNQWRTNWNGLTGLARCRTPRDVLELQSTVVRENVQGVLDSARRVSEISTGVAKEVARTIGSPTA